MKVLPLPPLEFINQLLDYYPGTGILRWKVSKGSVKIGDVAGSKNNGGYLQIKINNYYYMAHRLAYYIVTGQQPIEVDHKNGIRNDNRISNLRSATSKLNSNNKNKYNNNTSGITGVSWRKRDNCWKAHYYLNCKQVNYYNKDFFEAVCWRKSLELKYGMSELKKHRAN